MYGHAIQQSHVVLPRIARSPKALVICWKNPQEETLDCKDKSDLVNFYIVNIKNACDLGNGIDAKFRIVHFSNNFVKKIAKKHYYYLTTIFLIRTSIFQNFC